MKNLKCRHSFKECNGFYEIVMTITRRFTYDRLNRLTAQTSSDGYNTAYTYNLNSSPRTIMRYGLTSDGTVGVVDDLTMSYRGNRLVKTVDYAEPVLLESSLDFASTQAIYSYDNSGRMTADTGRDIEICYNEIDRPSTITDGNGQSLTYTYAANGQKLAERYRRPMEYGAEFRYYIGPFELSCRFHNKPAISRINTRFGYFTGEGAAMKTVADYQGNIRAVVGVDGTAIQTTDYYPYGLPMATSTGTAANRYKYGAKEFETRNGLNFHDFEARMLFNDITLFSRPDDLAGKYPHLNPYLYCAANPLRYIDPTGEDIWRINEKGVIAEFIETKEYDRIEFIDNNNNIVTDSEGNEQYLQFDYGTITHSKQSYSNVSSKNNGNMSGEFDVFKIDGDRNATSFFEMFAQNVTAKTGNEIGLIRTGKVGTGANYITSAQKKDLSQADRSYFIQSLKMDITSEK